MTLLNLNLSVIAHWLWMFCGRNNNVHINHINERKLRAVHNAEVNLFDEL